MDFHDYLKKNPLVIKSCLSLVKIIDVNKTAVWLHGASSKEELMSGLFANLTEKGIEAVEHSLIAIWNGKLECEINSALKGPDDKIIEVIMQWRVGTGCEQDYSHIYLTLVDITDLKDTQRELLNQKNELSVTLSGITDAVITIGLQGNVISMNPKAREITGYTESSFNNFSIDTWYEKSTFRFAPGVLNPVRALLQNKPVPAQDAIIRFRTAAGVELRLEHICTPLRDENGTLSGVILLLRDLTQIHKMMEQVQKTDRLESLGVLAGGIAHDFNNLLGGLFGYIDMALSVSTDPETNCYLQKACKVFERAKDLTSQLLTFTKSGLPERKTGSVVPVVIDAMNFALAGKEITRKFDISDELANCDFDTNQIAQVIDNICINAVQAMNGSGSIHVKINNCNLAENDVEDLHPGQYVLIQISDTGPGISSEIMKRIFDPFFTTKVQGNGLGLATSFSIIRRHDGRIIAESQDGIGATFKIYLPASSEKELGEVVNDKEHRGNGVVIIMDDESYIRDVVAGYVKKMGYTPVVASCGEDALESVRKIIDENKSISGFLLDITVPGGMGGIQCIQKIRELYTEGFSIAMSGYSQDEVMESPVKFGFTTSIKKPFRKRDLNLAFNRCVSGEKTPTSVRSQDSLVN
ncbi:MAG: response regulator [Fibrobacter sp.]|nr:response regulator [Fibrobacter sp.]